MKNRAGKVRIRGLGALALLAAATGAGCSGSAPRLDVPSAIGAAVGLESAIEFRVEGGPLDEPSVLDSGPTLTIAEAVRRGATSDPAIQAALARVRAALADAKQARLLPNPVLSLALRFPESGGRPSIEASLAQDLLSLLRRPREASAADNLLREAAAEALVVALDSVAEVQDRYAAVQALDGLLPILERRRGIVEDLLKQEQARLDAGEGTRQDLATLRTQLIEIEVEIAERRRERRDERLRLARLIGEPSSPADWTLDPWSAPRPLSAAEDEWIETALAHRPEVEAIRWRLAALGDRLALAGLLPFEGAEAGVDAERDGGEWAIGPALAAPVPIFDMGQARRERATAEIIEARHDLTRASRLVVEDVRRAYEALVRTEANLARVREELIPLQEERRALAEAAFRNGLTDITSLFLAEQDLQAAFAQAIELEREATLAQVRLRRAVGGAGAAASVARSEEGSGNEADEQASARESSQPVAARNRN